MVKPKKCNTFVDQQTQPTFLGSCLLAMPLLYKPYFWDRNLESTQNSELRNSAKHSLALYIITMGIARQLVKKCKAFVDQQTQPIFKTVEYQKLSFWDRNMISIVEQLGIWSVIFDPDSINNFKLKSFPLKGVYVLHYMLTLQQYVYEYLNIHKTRGSNRYFTRRPTSAAKFSIQ